jgi:hypothetical protein
MWLQSKYSRFIQWPSPNGISFTYRVERSANMMKENLLCWALGRTILMVYREKNQLHSDQPDRKQNNCMEFCTKTDHSRCAIQESRYGIRFTADLKLWRWLWRLLPSGMIRHVVSYRRFGVKCCLYPQGRKRGTSHGVTFQNIVFWIGFSFNAAIFC